MYIIACDAGRHDQLGNVRKAEVVGLMKQVLDLFPVGIVPGRDLERPL